MSNGFHEEAEKFLRSKKKNEIFITAASYIKPGCRYSQVNELMATGLVEGAVLGAVAGELLRAVLNAIDTASKFESIFKRLESTLNSLIPKINEIEQLNEEYYNKDDIGELILLLQNGKELVHKCSKITCWNYCKKYQYTKKLLALDDSLHRFCQIELQLVQLKEMKLIVLAIKEVNEKLMDGNSRDRISRVVSGLKRIVQLLPKWIIVFLNPSAWIRRWGYQRITSGFCPGSWKGE